MSLRLLNAITGTTSAPTLATDGFTLNGVVPGAGNFYWLKAWNDAAIMLDGAGTGALTFQGILWLYSVTNGKWMPAGISATIADRGKLNDGTTLTGTTTLLHTQPASALGAYDRVALQATTLTGTSMTVNAYLVPQGKGGFT